MVDKQVSLTIITRVSAPRAVQNLPSLQQNPCLYFIACSSHSSHRAAMPYLMELRLAALNRNPAKRLNFSQVRGRLGEATPGLGQQLGEPASFRLPFLPAVWHHKVAWDFSESWVWFAGGKKGVYLRVGSVLVSTFLSQILSCCLRCTI